MHKKWLLILILSFQTNANDKSLDSDNSVSEANKTEKTMNQVMPLFMAYNFKQNSDLVSSSGMIKGVDFTKMANDGYALVINLLPDDSEHARKNEKQHLEEVRIDYQHIPVDWNKPHISEFELFEQTINKYPHKKIHVHCAANYRATVFYGVYAYRNKGWSRSQLNDFIATIWKLSDYPVWSNFVRKLTE